MDTGRVLFIDLTDIVIDKGRVLVIDLTEIVIDGESFKCVLI